jgi:Resolvase, N terminal domain
MDREQLSPRRAVAYLRVAHASDDSENVIVAQRAACEQIAQRYGLTIIREYVDQGKPARLTQQTALRTLLDDLEQHQDVTHVIVADYARLGRNLQSLDDVISRIQSCGAEVATITGVEVAERFALAPLLDHVAEWARRPTERGEPTTNEPNQLASSDDLTTAIQTIRTERLNSNQREALAALLGISGNATALPTPVAAAVFNAVEACKRTVPIEEVNDNNEGR